MARHFTQASAVPGQLALLEELKARNYRFVTPTPATHARVVARLPATARDLRGVLGWSLPFDEAILDTGILALLAGADALTTERDGRLRSRYRVASLGEDLYLHSAYPTEAEDAVFFGPDSYRFARLIAQELATCPQRAAAQLVDIGTGTGVGGVVAARLCPDLAITMTDINPRALELAAVNSRAAGVAARLVLGPELASIEGPLDIVLANPPYIIDPGRREYRDGGDMRGGRVAFEMAKAAASRLGPSGRFILYTGSAIADGEDLLRAALTQLAEQGGCALRYEEIDPDVFGEELSKPAYRDVERIAVVGAVLTRQG
jgi:methylase of polypeptide subunit release factors